MPELYAPAFLFVRKGGGMAVSDHQIRIRLIYVVLFLLAVAALVARGVAR